MKKLVYFVIAFILLCLIIPAVSFLYDGGNNKKSDTNFYLVLNDKTGEVMKLKPAEYIMGVVAGEMPMSFDNEALKAQAVAAHSYTLRQISKELKNPSAELKGAYLSTNQANFQSYISKDEMKKLWGNNFDIYYKKLSDAVNSVSDIVMTYNGEPIAAAFHAISSGQTESAENIWGSKLPYLVPVKSEGDSLSPDFEQSVSLTYDEVKTALSKKYSDITFPDDKTKYFEIKSTSSSGTVLTLAAGSKEIKGTDLRTILNLRSAVFAISKTETGYKFATKGYGHGVGMSQYGADYMARQGSDYKSILSHYYTDIKFENFKIPS